MLSVAAGSLGMSALGAVATAVPGAATATSAANADADPLAGPGFALLGDTQVGPSAPHRADWVRWVYDHIAGREAAAVCHVGDIVNYGSVDEYDAYLSTVPDDLWPRMRHVPGNHEWRWDATARERYHELLGDTRYAFDAAGIRFIALDPSHLLQEGGGFGDHGLAWLVDQLEQAPAGTPIILMCHFPIGGDNYYLSDQQRLLDILYSYNVRAIFAGHIHSEQMHRFNGITQLAVNGTLNAPLYYWLQRRGGPGGPELVVTEVRRNIDDEDAVATRDVGTIPLGGQRIAQHQRPSAIDLNTAGTALRVSVRLRSPAAGSNVRAQLYPQHTYAVKNPGQWRDLAPDRPGRTFTGQLDISELPPGSHRMTVRVAADDAWYEETVGFAVPGDDRVRWRVPLGAPVQAGLAAFDDVLVAATSGGTVLAGQVSPSGLDELWSLEIGGVIGQPVVSPDGTTVYVPSQDHHLYACDLATGRIRFRYDAGDPVLGNPLLTEIGDEPALIVGAGDAVHVVDASDGARRWSRPEPGMFAGRAACDGEYVCTGGGRGRAFGFDARTGEVAWSFLTNNRESAYRRLIYGPWYDSLALLPQGRVLVSTVQNAFALDRATGARAWSVPGSYVFAPKAYHGNDALVMVDDWARTVSLMNPETGGMHWTVSIGVRALNTGAVLHGGRAWVHGTTGQLTAVDLETGEVAERLQLTATANNYSTPTVAAGMLVVGDQDGVLHGLTVD